MKRLFAASGYVCLFLVIGYKASTFGTQWTWGPKYRMPVALLSPDGKHFADGTPLDPFTVAEIKSGYEEEIWLGACLVFTGLMLWLVHELQKAKRFEQRIENRPNASLDAGLMDWNHADKMRRRDVLNGGILIMGRPGSGKTSASGRVIARAIASDPLSTFLILSAKPEDKQMWQQIFADKKRELLVFDPGGNLKCDMIDFIQRMGGDTREVVSFILTATEVLRGESNQGGGEYGSFFQDEEKRGLYHGVEIQRQAGVAVSAPNIQRFISGAALSKEQLNSAQWREGFHNACIRAAVKRQGTAREKHDLEMAINYWVHEWPVMAQRTRSCILAGMLNKLFYFNSGIARELIASGTNCSPLDMLYGGKSILVNAPSCEYGDTGALISSCWKYLTQKCVLSREFKPGCFYSIVWADEAWQVTTSFDQHYAATSRSHGGAMVYLAQSRDSFYSALKGEDGKNFSNALLGMFHHKIFHALGSADDAEYASSLLGRQRELFVSGGTQPYQDVFDGFLGNGQFTASTSEQYQPILQPRVLLSNLRTGGPENNYLADAIVIRTGEPFKSTGQNFLHVTFSQR